MIYYILNKEVQEFLVKIKMLFLRSLEIFISSREINLCRLDTFHTMIVNRPVIFNRVPAFGLLWILLSTVAAIHKSQIDASCLYWLQIKNRRCQTWYFFLNKACGGFQEFITDFLCEFVHFMWHRLTLTLRIPQLEKFLLTQTELAYPLWT